MDDALEPILQGDGSSTAQHSTHKHDVWTHKQRGIMGARGGGAARVSAAAAGLTSNVFFKTMTACSSSLVNDPFAPAASIPTVKIKRLKTIVRFVQACERPRQVQRLSASKS